MSRTFATAGLCAALIAGASAQDDIPTARLISASRLVMPGAVDSNVPMTWDLVDGVSTLFALTSWGGIPALLSGRELSGMQRVVDAVAIVPHPGHGLWIESLIAGEDGTWYGYYHHEAPADRCGRGDRQIPRLGAAKSTDRGRTWQDLGVILEAPPDSDACASSNRFVLGGVGDVSVMLDEQKQDLYLYFSQYSRDRRAQGVALARLAWADRDAPVGKIAVWNDEAWLPATPKGQPSGRPVQQFADEEPIVEWEYPAGTPLVPVSQPWHDADSDADAYWGPSVHWNTYLERYVMLLNRTKNERFDNEGIYVSYSRALDDPRAWTAPKKLMNGGGWYPQVAGLDAGQGTDKQAGRRARFFLTGKSDQMIEFTR